MKFEVKTQNHDLSKSSFAVFLSLSLLSIIIILLNFSIKLNTLSKYYEINYLCKLLSVEKSSVIFKKLSKLTNNASKQKIWDLCREIIK
tara:strand:+ start:154 stop:420 length:267 start_codon:yes stop_codon:yes gene_type:complete